MNLELTSVSNSGVCISGTAIPMWIQSVNQLLNQRFQFLHSVFGVGRLLNKAFSTSDCVTGNVWFSNTVGLSVSDRPSTNHSVTSEVRASIHVYNGQFCPTRKRITWDRPYVTFKRAWLTYTEITKTQSASLDALSRSPLNAKTSNLMIVIKKDTLLLTFNLQTWRHPSNLVPTSLEDIQIWYRPNTKPFKHEDECSNEESSTWRIFN